MNGRGNTIWERAPRGGADAWDAGLPGQFITEDFFGAPPAPPAGLQAVRFDSADDILAMPAAAVPSGSGGWTVAVWLRLTTDRNAPTMIWSFDGIFSSSWHALETDSSGTSLRVYETGVTAATIATLSVGVWYFVVVRKTAGGTIKTYLGDEAFGTLATAAGSVTNLTYAGDGYVGGSAYGTDEIDGRLWGMRVWDTDLTDAEVDAEFASATGAAIRTTNRRAEWLLDDDVTPGTDSSGNARHLTNPSGLGAWTLEAGPTFPSGSAAALEASLTGSATLSAGLTTAIRPAANLTGSATLAAALTTAIRPAAALTGAATLGASLTTAISLASSLSGSATLAAALTAGSTLAAGLSGTATLGASLTTGIALSSALTGTATAAAALTTAIRPAAALNGTATLGAALTTSIRLAAAPAGAATLAAALTTGIRLAAAPQGSATLAAALTTAIRPAATLSGSATLSASLTAGGAAALASSLSSSATLGASLTTAIRPAASLSGSATLGAALTTSIRLASTLSGTASSSAALTTAIPLSASLAGSATLSAGLTTAISLAADLSSTADLVADLTAINLSVPETPIEIVVRAERRTLYELSEPRTLTPAGERRSLFADAERRTLTPPAERRTLWEHPS